MARPLGKNQLAWLEAISERQQGSWHEGCGHYWSTILVTTRMCQRMEELGLLCSRIERVGLHGHERRVWRITDLGRKAAANYGVYA